jgi:amino acid transporter
MRLDIRIPIGLLFIVLGAILTIFGPLAKQQIYDEHSLGINVNLWWGLVMLAFGIFMFVMGLRGTSAVRSTEDSPEGRKLEEAEQRREGGPPGGH